MKLIKKILTFFIFFVFGYPISYSQTIKPSYSIEEIQEIVEWKFGYNLDTINLCELYIIDGVPFDKEHINSELSKHNKTDVFGITFIKETSWNGHNNCNLVTILRTENQSKKEKKKIFKHAIEIYNREVPDVITHDWNCVKCPVLSLNDKVITNTYKMKQIINELKISEIKSIIQITQPLNPEYFGQYAKNGIIEIILK